MKQTQGCLAVAFAVALGGAGCVGKDGADDPSGDTSGWQQLEQPPLSGRVDSVVAAVADRMVVVGGWDFLCPAGANCVPPETPPHADGAAYDLVAGLWAPIADAPVGLRTAVSAVVGTDVYVLSQCDPGPNCPAGHGFLRYRSDDDAWDRLPAPDRIGNHGLVAIDDGVVAFSSSDEGESLADYRFFSDDGRWEQLPDDPLPPVFDRFVVEHQGHLLLFGSPLARPQDKTKLAAAYDTAEGSWEVLTDSGTQGYQVWRAGKLLYLNPHFGAAGGGVYDPSADAWSSLPDPPTHDMAGIIGDDEATYEYAAGWVLDARTGTWLEVAPRTLEPGNSEVVTATSRGELFVFGGQAWSEGEAALSNDTWLWTPPSR